MIEDADILRLCKQTDHKLWAAYKRSNRCDFSDTGTGKLIFPRYRNEGLRVSEQEARFAFVEVLQSSPFMYSVETPTIGIYTFSGTKPISAQTDLTLYDCTGTERVCNVEFKCKGFSPDAKDDLSISKDIEKLLREPVRGLWFHLMERVNSTTINKLLSVMKKTVHPVCKKIKEELNDIDTKGLSFHICVLSEGYSIHRVIPPAANGRFSCAELQNMFEPELHFSGTEVKHQMDDNGCDPSY